MKKVTDKNSLKKGDKILFKNDDQQDELIVDGGRDKNDRIIVLWKGKKSFLQDIDFKRGHVFMIKKATQKKAKAPKAAKAAKPTTTASPKKTTKKKSFKSSLSAMVEREKASGKGANFVEKISQPTKKSRFKFSDVQNVRVDDIVLKPAIFQGRTVPFAAETVAKIVNEGYDTTQEPIVLFRMNNENVVISGHSRFEAAKKLKLQRIPVKFFIGGDLDDAIDYAVIESNRSGKAEGIESDVKAYLRAKERGYNREKLLGIFKEGSYLYTLDKLSQLNANGRFIEALVKSNAETGESKAFPYLLRNAVWVGTLRKIYKDLTNEHESEMFKFFYSSETKGLKIKKDAFFNLVKSRVERPDFDKTKSLRLSREKEFESVKDTDPGFIRYMQTRAAINEYNNELLQIQEQTAYYIINNNADKVKENNEQIANMTKRVVSKFVELLKLREGLKREDKRLQTSGLF